MKRRHKKAPMAAHGLTSVGGTVRICSAYRTIFSSRAYSKTMDGRLRRAVRLGDPRSFEKQIENPSLGSVDASWKVRAERRRVGRATSFRINIMHLKRRTFAALALAAAAVASVAPLARAQEALSEVRLAYAGGPRVWILAKADGAFDKAFGVKTRWIAFASGADVLTLFAAKEIDIARFGSSPAAAGFARKLPIETIGVSGVIATSERLIAKAGVADLKGLEGKTVGAPANSTAQYALEQAIRLNGVDRGKVKIVALKPAEIVAAWTRGDIDAGYVWGPFTQQLEAAGGKQIFATRDLQKDGVLVFNNFVVRKEFAEKHPDIVVKFLKVYQEKVDEYKRDPDKAAKIIADHLSIPFDVSRETLAGLEYPSIKDQLTPQFEGDGATTPNSRIAKAYKDSAEFLASIGELRKDDIPASFAPFINTEYLKKAAQ
jgi:taurine transport system substrate-binding protein